MIGLNLAMFEKEILPALKRAEKLNACLLQISATVHRTSFWDFTLLRIRILGCLWTWDNVMDQEEYKRLVRSIDAIESAMRKPHK